MRLGRPVGLGRREPVGEESDHELWRVHPAMHQAIDRRQAECRAELIHGRLERAIDQEPVREAEERALEPHRLGRRDPHVPRHPLVDQAADDARLQVDGRRRHAEPLLRDAGAERDPGEPRRRCRHPRVARCAGTPRPSPAGSPASRRPRTLCAGATDRDRRSSRAHPRSCPRAGIPLPGPRSTPERAGWSERWRDARGSGAQSPRARTGWTSPALPMVGRSSLSDRVAFTQLLRDVPEVRRQIRLRIAQDFDDRPAIRQRQRRSVARLPLLSGQDLPHPPVDRILGAGRQLVERR